MTRRDNSLEIHTAVTLLLGCKDLTNTALPAPVLVA
jgi:hypothetical protein